MSKQQRDSIRNAPLTATELLIIGFFAFIGLQVVDELRYRKWKRLKK